MSTKLISSILLLVVLGWSAHSSAHKYFFGLTELTVNPKTQSLEVIHQFTAHDIENAIAIATNENFSPEHAQYEQYIQSYFQAHFSISKLDKSIPLKWVGLEIVNGNMYVYQEAPFKNFLPGLVVKNELLIDTYSNQVNTVNYQDNKVQGSLTFTSSQLIAKIDNIN
ncbi:DUF6702 family protein [Thalassotalea piscium]